MKDKFLSTLEKRLTCKGSLQHAISTFCHMRFQFLIRKFLIKMQRIAVHFYLGYWNQPWFGPAGSENACIFRRVATQLYMYQGVKQWFSTFGCWRPTGYIIWQPMCTIITVTTHLLRNTDLDSLDWAKFLLVIRIPQKVITRFKNAQKWPQNKHLHSRLPRFRNH